MSQCVNKYLSTKRCVKIVVQCVFLHAKYFKELRILCTPACLTELLKSRSVQLQPHLLHKRETHASNLVDQPLSIFVRVGVISAHHWLDEDCIDLQESLDLSRDHLFVKHEYDSCFGIKFDQLCCLLTEFQTIDLFEGLLMAYYPCNGKSFKCCLARSANLAFYKKEKT